MLLNTNRNNMQKVPCYMRDSTSTWRIVKKAKIF